MKATLPVYRLGDKPGALMGYIDKPISDEPISDAVDASQETCLYLAHMMKFIAVQTGAGYEYWSMIQCFLSAARADITCLPNPAGDVYCISKNDYMSSLANSVFDSLVGVQPLGLTLTGEIPADLQSLFPISFSYYGFDDDHATKVKTAHYYSYLLYHLAKGLFLGVGQPFDYSCVENETLINVLTSDFRGVAMKAAPSWMGGKYATYSGALKKYGDPTDFHPAMYLDINRNMQEFIGLLVRDEVCTELARVYKCMSAVAGYATHKTQLDRVVTLFEKFDLTLTREASQAANLPHINGFFVDNKSQFSGLCIVWITDSDRANTLWIFCAGDAIIIIHHPHGEGVYYTHDEGFTNPVLLQRGHAGETGPYNPDFHPNLPSMVEKGFAVCCGVVYDLQTKLWDVALIKIDVGVGHMSATPIVSAREAHSLKNVDGVSLSGSAPDE